MVFAQLTILTFEFLFQILQIKNIFVFYALLMTFTFITAEKDGKTNRDRVHGDKCTGQRTKKLL